MPNAIVNISVTPPYAPFRQCKQLVSLAPRLTTIWETRGPNTEICVCVSVCACVRMLCVSPRLMDLLEMASGIYYHV